MGFPLPHSLFLSVAISSIQVFIYLYGEGVCICVCVVCVFGEEGKCLKYFCSSLFFFFPSCLWVGFERLDVGRDVCLFPEGERLGALSLEHTGGGTEHFRPKTHDCAQVG